MSSRGARLVNGGNGSPASPSWMTRQTPPSLVRALRGGCFDRDFSDYWGLIDGQIRPNCAFNFCRLIAFRRRRRRRAAGGKEFFDQVELGFRRGIALVELQRLRVG